MDFTPERWKSKWTNFTSRRMKKRLRIIILHLKCILDFSSIKAGDCLKSVLERNEYSK